MNYAIIAAGEGSRLAQEGVNEPKPLVKVQNEHLIDRLIRVFMDNDAEKITIICNSLTTKVSQHLLKLEEDGLNGRPVPLNFIVKTTPSSMHSFYELSKLLDEKPFVMTTVDTIFKAEEFGKYISEFRNCINAGYDGLMGVTDFIDDEKPLYVGSDEEMNVTGFFDSNENGCKYISGGIYGLNARALDTLNDCMERGESRMRNFQRGLIRDGRKLKAFAFSKVMDIDHAEDIVKAEQFLGQEALLYFSELIAVARSLGINDLIVDPGFGFAKTLEQNYEMLQKMELFQQLKLPVLVGISRKSMIYKTLNNNASESLNGTTTLNTISLLKGANILRVHDVKEAVECVTLFNKMNS